MSEEYNFKTFKRFDKQIAAEGAWFDAYDENGNLWGRFKASHYDGTKPSVALAVTRAKKRHMQAIRTKTHNPALLTLDIMIEAETIKDWEMKNAHDVFVPFSIEALRKFFSKEETHWIIFRLSDFSDDITNFDSQDEDTEAKND